MVDRHLRFILAVGGALLAACATSKTMTPVSTESVAPATSVTRRGAPVRLLGTPIAVGMPLPTTALVDAGTMRQVDLSAERGKVLFLSLIISIDTGL